MAAKPRRFDIAAERPIHLSPACSVSKKELRK
jgi:hypothetical protein